MRQQLHLVGRATIAVSPPGGVSMILPFMPAGAHVILINYMTQERGKRVTRAAAAAAAAAAATALPRLRSKLFIRPCQLCLVHGGSGAA